MYENKVLNPEGYQRREQMELTYYVLGQEKL